MNEKKINDIEVVKVKKKKQRGSVKFILEDKKKTTANDQMPKFSSKRYSVKYDISNVNILSQLQLKDPKTKRRKSAAPPKDIFKKNSIESIKLSLENINEMVIKQEADILEAVTGCQEPNCYRVYGKLPNGEKIYIFKCREFSSCGMRYFCPVNCREFLMKIKLSNNEDENNEDEEFEDSIINIDKKCKCPFLCFIRPDMNVIITEKKTKLGRIEQVFSFCDPIFYIYDKDDKEIFYIEANCCQCGLMCRNNFMGKTDEAHFYIYNIGDTTKPVGDICKKAAKSMFSIADNYSVILPEKATIEEKILLTVAGIMIDYQYFEKNTKSK